jgi:ferric-dicitrate binding protein FerR (iron transport regulator)
LKEAVENPQLFARLFSKYLDNRCSPEEIDHLMRLLQSEEYKVFAGELIESKLKQKPDIHEPDPALKERLDVRLQHIFDNATRTIPKRRQLTIWRWAAAACIVATLSVGLYRLVAKRLPAENNVVAKVSLHAVPLTGYTRYLTLSDGSSVVLHAGSKLEYPAEFKGGTREVILSGEAYFDIAHNPAKPFIIHTGKIRTTVLGTAFNIKSDEKQVIVSVTRGKVKVESGSTILAVLTPNEQVQYDVPEAVSVRHTVNAASIVTHWTQEDMVFNGIPFEEIANLLSKRYGVPVQFKNESLKKCKIRASFSGTETLEQVSSVLCAIRNGSFEQLTDGTILFNGEGCE